MTKLIVVGVLLFSLFVAAPAYMTKMYDDNRSAQHRVDMWIQGVEMVRYYPVFGIGRGNYEAYTGRLIAHNSALELAGETGLPGIFLWVALLFVSFKTLRVYLRRAEDPVDRSYTMALAISLAGYLVSAMFVTLEYETLYFMIGMTAAVGHQLDHPVGLDRREMMLVGFLVLGFLFAVKLFTTLYY